MLYDQLKKVYQQGNNQGLESVPTTENNLVECKLINNFLQPLVEYKDNGLTIPIRFSRHRITELLVAAEQTASFFPCNSNWAKNDRLES